MQSVNGGHLVTLNSDVHKISKTLEPLPTMADQIAKILTIVEEIRHEPHLSSDKAQRIDNAIKELGTITAALKDVLTVLEGEKAELIQRVHDSKPIPIILPEQPNGKEQ